MTRLQGSLDTSRGNPTLVAVDPSVIAALEHAVATDPHNPALRVHLASLLVMSGDAGRALEHAQTALAIVPDDVEALAAARDGARALGDGARADAYHRILERIVEDPADPATWSDMPPPREDAMPGFGPRWADAAPDEPISLPKGFTELDPEGLVEAERPRVTLADVGGLEEVKARLDAAFLAPLRDPAPRTRFGPSLRGGLLLYGPPGCGKTFLARAVAGELGASFFALDLDAVLAMWLGESERRLHDAFAKARRAGPCVLLLDGLGALARSAGRSFVNRLLAELDGAHAANEGVFVLAATNHPWDVDTALRRPGRLDRTVLVLPPDAKAREAILRRALDRRPIAGADPAELARRTEGCSGADLVHIVETASEHARPVTVRQLEQAASDAPRSPKAWFGVARDHARYANAAGQYDDLLAYIRAHKLL